MNSSMNVDELERILAVVVAYFKVLSQHLVGGTHEYLSYDNRRQR